MQIPMSASFLGKFDKDGKTYDPQRRSMGYILFMFRENAVGKALKLVNNDPASILALSLDELVIPKTTVNTLEWKWHGEKRKFPVSVENEDMVITIRDFVDVPAAELLEVWFTHVYNAWTGQIGLKVDMVADAYVVLFDHSSGEVTRYYYLSEIFPVELDNGSISQSDSDIVKIAATFVVSKIMRISKEKTKQYGMQINNVDLKSAKSWETSMSYQIRKDINSGKFNIF